MSIKFNYKKYRRLLREIPKVYGAKASIVRLKLTDFIIYNHVELFAGPNVNFIIGPNGIGKSTIVCAICLGLAGKPKLLGRASGLKEYIRRGCHQATIEIELFNPLSVSGMERNYVVKRVIQEAVSKEKGLKDKDKSTVSSEWYWNGRRVPEKEVGD
ncbi:unnamed protein product [Allacma fusca]|uniref:Rad50/SbcC-type AAA domain-containing protein n=1 Tax=Allacma fusca TaxID=39272 RepID=A0A8J2L3Y9_9HEXA|nr:unnamed protein product [Allacma fusca]